MKYVIIIHTYTYKYLILRNAFESGETFEEDRVNIILLAKALQAETGFTALDFFIVDRSMLTSVFATFLTYLVILGQSNIC